MTPDLDTYRDLLRSLNFSKAQEDVLLADLWRLSNVLVDRELNRTYPQNSVRPAEPVESHPSPDPVSSSHLPNRKDTP